MSILTLHGIHSAQGSVLDGEFFRQHGFTAAPIVVQCHLTLRCGLACAHCLAVHPGVRASDMPLVLWDKLCRESAALGVEEMLLTGGEPLRRDDFDGIVDCLRRYSLTWSLNTATCPSPSQQAAILRYPPAYVAVSLDGPADVHNAFRGSASAFTDATASLRFFSGIRGTTVCAGTTITTRNLPYFEETSALVRETGAHRWGIHLLLPEGRAQTREDLFPSTRQLRTLLESIARKRSEFPVSLCDELGFAGEWEPLVRDAGFFCAAGRAMCAVLPDGSVMPCSTLDPRHSQGNLNHTPLAEVWRTGFATQRRFQPKGKCARCPDLTVCGSGCWLQRVHGTQCFRQLWKIPDSFKATGIALCLGGLGGSAAQGQAPTAEMAVADAQDPDSGNTATPISPIIINKGIYASKSGGDQQHPYRANKNALARPALLWLQQQQNKDGTWGRPPHRATLTALAVLAYFSQGENVHSENFGNTITEGLRAVLNQVKDSPSDQQFDSREKILPVWCLAEAFLMTRIPSLRQALPDDPGRFLVDNATPWHLLAWEALNRSRNISAPQPMDDLAPRLSDQQDNITWQALRCLISIRTKGLGASSDEIAELGAAPLDQWRNSDEPLTGAFMVNLVMQELKGQAQFDWNNYFLPAASKSQVVRDSVGWWDAASLGIAQPRETDSMSEVDARIFTTALMVLCLQTCLVQ